MIESVITTTNIQILELFYPTPIKKYFPVPYKRTKEFTGSGINWDGRKNAE
jgi:hypothetical protein